METTIGGNRLGSGNKQTLNLKDYSRSSHDIGFNWKSTMASGTLVPFMSKLALPGDTWDIRLNCEVLTLPTLGPLFGSYKVQLDIFEVPIRLYIAQLHNNKLGIGMSMKNVLLPQIEVQAVNRRVSGTAEWTDNEQINASSLLKYLGISGLGRYTGTVNPIKRKFNAIPYLGYWDIYKTYYSNKQEEKGFYIHTGLEILQEAQTPIVGDLYDINWDWKQRINSGTSATVATGDNLNIVFPANALKPKFNTVTMTEVGQTPKIGVNQVFTVVTWDENNKVLSCESCRSTYNNKNMVLNTGDFSIPAETPTTIFGLAEFDLANIDTMKENILKHDGATAFIINDISVEPYNAPMQLITGTQKSGYATVFSQEALAIKTYQSDLFNNWINTEWIDGPEGISALTAVDTSDGTFTIDALNIAQKLYNMLGRIAVSGGTYDDWLNAVYTHERIKGIESPVYHGSLIKELAFQEIVSLSEINTVEAGRQPLGTLAGKGRLTSKHKGGEVKIKTNEPSYIIGIISITPRIVYSQGNQWDVNLKSMDDFHKPALDAIGFQDLITENLLWSDTLIDPASGELTRNTLGKQPAWINYMSDVDKCYGGFAEEGSMFMTLNRRYNRNADGSIKDPTTYIDPTKFNNIFAETALDAQNFWVQVGIDIQARRKMSAKVIPNL